MQNLMMFHCSNKTIKQIVTAFFIVGLCLVLAFSVIAPPIAYANEINQMLEVVGFIVGAVGGGYVTSACLAAAGVTTAAVFSSTVAALLVILAAVGIGIGVASIIHLLTSEESLDLFGVQFWQVLSKCWDNTKQKFTCAASVFKWLVYRVQYLFGVSAPEEYFSIPYMEFDSLSDINNSELYELEGNPQHFPYDKTMLQNFSTSAEYTSINVLEVNILNEDSDPNNDINMILDILNNNFQITFSENKLCFPVLYDSGLPQAYGVSLPLLIGEDELYFSTLKSWNYNRLLYRYDNYHPSLNDKQLTFDKYNNSVTDGSLNYYCSKPDGTFLYPSSLANFFYYVFICDYPIIASTAPVSVDDTVELNEETSSVFGNLTGTIASGINATVVGKYSKESTYDKDKDIVGSLAGAIGTAATGDVTITAAEVPNVTVDDATDISTAITVTDVQANDVVNTETNTEVMLGAQTAWVTGLNTLKIASAGISDKFPFCIPSYLKDQLNILVGEKKEPIFVIPFKIQSANISESITIDLTKFDKLLSVTDFFIVAILVVGLAFSTKKLLF